MIEKLLDRMRRYFEITPYMPIIEWAEKYVDFSLVPGAGSRKIDFSLYPHTREPVEQFEFDGRIVRMTVCGIEQHGKTQIETLGVLYSMVYRPGTILCVYPSEELAAEINLTKYEPLMKKIPQLARELQRPNSRRVDRYKFTNNTMLFQGAGTKIMSISANIAIGDEIDQHPKRGNSDSVADLRKRTRSFSESINCNVCTPTTEDGPIWQEFLRGSRGYWTLRCRGCGQLTMRSCDFSNFQFDKKFDDVLKLWRPVPESIRLICPVCKHEHAECDKFFMNQHGAYVHERPDLISSAPSYQFGILCSLKSATDWRAIAEKITECGLHAGIRAHIELDNSWRGLPYRPRQVTDDDFDDLKKHVAESLPKPEEIEFIFAVSDTQDTFSPTGVFAYDVNDNLHLIEYRNIEYLRLDAEERERLNAVRERDNRPPVETVEDIIHAEYLKTSGVGIPVLFHIIDEKGHRTREVENFIRNNRKSIAYCGSGLKVELWRPSQRKPRTVIVNTRHFQTELIYRLYSHKNRSNNFLYFPPGGLSKDVMAEITSVRPDKSSKFGHMPENWTPGEAVHDAFDVLKMAYFGIDYALKMIPRNRFRFCRSPEILKRRGARVDEPSKIKKEGIAPAVKRGSFFSGGGYGWR